MEPANSIFEDGAIMRVWTQQLKRLATPRGLALALVVLFAPYILAQETTGGLQGTVKDPSGAVVAGADVVATTPTLVGSKETRTDSSGYYRFANLPSGSYTILVKAQGFETLKRSGVVLEVGHLPTVDLLLTIGTVNTVLEVKTEGPMIDTTSNTTLTNIPEDVLQDIPHGTSFQSVIQFAPAARNEPLAGGAMFSNGTGGTSPGNGGNGGQFGFSIGGAADSENSYLVEGQETADIIGGYSHTNVPMDFISEVQMKTSGVEAEHGGALGGVVNVIMEKGTKKWHGGVFTSFQDNAMNGSPVATSRYNPEASLTSTSWGKIDPGYQQYEPVKPQSSDFWPGVKVGGPIVDFFPKIYGVPDSFYSTLKDRVFGEFGFSPDFNSYERKLDYGPYGGVTPFSQNTHTFYGYGRIDAEVSSKVRVYASWLTQGQKQAGESLPTPDSFNGLYNPITDCSGKGSTLVCGGNFVDPTTFAHTLGYSAPNSTMNFGADVTITNSLVATTRFGYFFANYHDFGYETNSPIYYFENNGGGTNTDTKGNPLPAALAQSAGFQVNPLDQNFTHLNAQKAIQFDQDLAWFHGGKGGTHNLKFGYQFSRNSNYIFQGYNAPFVEIYPGTDGVYAEQTSTGTANCATIEASTGYSAGCTGIYGTVNVNDFGSGGKAAGVNHGFFAQDAWTLGKGITVDLGLRLEHEYLPAENQPATAKISNPIDFGWGAKIAPRVGAAWDVFKNGKMKVFGGYGQYFDMMKLNVAISSYGGQYWNECWYALNAPTYTGIIPSYDANNRDCAPGDSTQATFQGGAPSGLTFIENFNQRAWPTTCSTCSLTQEGTAPNLKPYAQHESDFGIDYQVAPKIAVEGRWDRRRLDHVIEDSSIFDPVTDTETFVIVNPGEGVNATFNSFFNFLYPTETLPACSGVNCPASKIIPPARSYDGVEVRVTKDISNHWMGMFSYTWSTLRGNYTGLTSTDQADGESGGRNAPNNSRAFDEPYFSWNALGGSSSGLLPTDRTNVLKGYVYYELPWLNKFTTDFGIFQDAYSGTPLTSFIDVGTWSAPGAFPVDLVDRGKWIDISQNASTGAISVSAPYTKRLPWFTQSDFNLKQSYKLGESKTISFDATFGNILNQRAVVQAVEQIDSQDTAMYLTPNGVRITAGPAFYGNAEHAYPYVANMQAVRSNTTGSLPGDGTGHFKGPMTVDSQYGKPFQYQLPRNIRLGVHITF